MPEDLLAEQIHQIVCRRSGGFVPPLWQWQIIVGSIKTVGENGSEQQQAVRSDLKLWLPIDRVRVARLCLSDADDAFFVMVVDLDFPAVEVSLHKGFQIEVGIGADDESWFAV